MKPILIALAATAMTFGSAMQAEAKDHGGNRYPTTVVVTGTDHRGRPVYAERYFIRMNAHGKPLFGYRPLPNYGGDRGPGPSRGGDHRGGGGHHHRR